MNSANAISMPNIFLVGWPSFLHRVPCIYYRHDLEITLENKAKFFLFILESFFLFLLRNVKENTFSNDSLYMSKNTAKLILVSISLVYIVQALASLAGILSHYVY